MLENIHLQFNMLFNLGEGWGRGRRGSMPLTQINSDMCTSGILNLIWLPFFSGDILLRSMCFFVVFFFMI